MYLTTITQAAQLGGALGLGVSLLKTGNGELKTGSEIAEYILGAPLVAAVAFAAITASVCYLGLGVTICGAISLMVGYGEASHERSVYTETRTLAIHQKVAIVAGCLILGVIAGIAADALLAALVSAFAGAKVVPVILI